MPTVLRAAARRRASRAVTTALLAAPLAFAGSAAAADAPLRSIGIGVDGKRTWQIAWFSSNDDATQVVGTIRPNDDFTPGKEEGVVARDVVAGQTTLLVPAPATLVAASADLQRLIFLTTTSYSPDDTNDLVDGYVLDRATGTKTLLTSGDDGKAIGDNTYPQELSDLRQFTRFAISSDGSKAQFGVLDGLGDSSQVRTWRVDLDTGVHTALTPGNGIADVIDGAGRLVVRDGIFVDGKKIADVGDSWTDFTLSSNDRYLGFTRYGSGGLVIFDLQTGTKVEFPSPTYPGKAYPRVRRVADDGKSLILSDRFGSQNDRSLRIFYGRVSTDGTLTQLGGGVRHSTWGRNNGDDEGFEQGNVTQDGQFAITGLHIAQLGDKPLPGTEPTAPRAEVFSDYVTVSDAWCTTSSFPGIPIFGRWRAPSVTVANTPQRANEYPVVSFKGKVTWLFGFDAYSSLPIVEPGPTYPLRRLGYLGGWKLSGTITFEDGSTMSGSKTVPFHGLPGCTWSLFG